MLDPKGRMQGKIDPLAPVTGSGKDVPMGEALERLTAPLGLRVVVRDEVIVLEAASRPAGGRRGSVKPTVNPNPRHREVPER